MSNIALYIDAELGAKELLSIKRLCGEAPSDVKGRLKNGEPLIERELFDNKYKETATILRELLDVLTIGNVPFRIYEFPEDVTMATCDFSDKFLITAEVLLNILAQSDSEFGQQIFS